MKLSMAYHCQDCQEIFERAPQGKCVRCASHEIVSLAWLVKSAAEREAWFERVRGGGSRLHERKTQPALRYSCPSLRNGIGPEAA